MKSDRLRRRANVAKAILMAQLTGSRRPIMANLLLTNRCNLNCFYCYVDVHHRTISEPSTEKVLYLIDELYNIGTRLFVLLGGEPLLRNDIGDIIKKIHKKGAACEVITNGFLVKKHIRELKGVDSICVSLDGPEESNDKNRGKCSFAAAVNAINLLIAHRIPTRIKGVITRNNFKDLFWLINFAQKKGIMVTMSTAATYDGRNYKTDTRWLNYNEEKAFHEKLFRYRKGYSTVGYSAKALRYCLNWPYPQKHIINLKKTNNYNRYPLIRCLRKDRSLYIDVDGGMYPCAAQWGKGDINAFRESIHIAWNHFEKFNCYSCASLPDIDITLLFNLNPENVYKAAGLL